MVTRISPCVQDAEQYRRESDIEIEKREKKRGREEQKEIESERERQIVIERFLMFQRPQSIQKLE